MYNMSTIIFTACKTHHAELTDAHMVSPQSHINLTLRYSSNGIFEIESVSSEIAFNTQLTAGDGEEGERIV